MDHPKRKDIFQQYDFITYDPLIYTMDHPKFIISNQKEESFCAQRGNLAINITLFV